MRDPPQQRRSNPLHACQVSDHDLHLASSEVDDSLDSPVAGKVLGRKSAVALIRPRLATQEHRPDFEKLAIDCELDPPLAHQPKEDSLVVCPGPAPLLEVVKHLLRWGEQWLVAVVGPTQLPEKERQVVRFAKPASWETLLSRTSIRRLTPAFLSRSKNRSADVWVKPIV